MGTLLLMTPMLLLALLLIYTLRKPCSRSQGWAPSDLLGGLLLVMVIVGLAGAL